MASGPRVHDASYAERVRASFARQRVMRLLEARLGQIAPGVVEIELPFRDDLVQQHGFFHAGIVTTIADSAGGYAAYTLLAPQDSVLTAEYKMNFLAPAQGDRLLATGRVVKPGRTLIVCDLRVEAIAGASRTTCAIGLQTIVPRARPPAGSAPG